MSRKRSEYLQLEIVLTEEVVRWLKKANKLPGLLKRSIAKEKISNSKALWMDLKVYSHSTIEVVHTAIQMVFRVQHMPEFTSAVAYFDQNNRVLEMGNTLIDIRAKTGDSLFLGLRPETNNPKFIPGTSPNTDSNANSSTSGERTSGKKRKEEMEKEKEMEKGKGKEKEEPEYEHNVEDLQINKNAKFEKEKEKIKSLLCDIDENLELVCSTRLFESNGFPLKRVRVVINQNSTCNALIEDVCTLWGKTGLKFKYGKTVLKGDQTFKELNVQSGSEILVTGGYGSR